MKRNLDHIDYASFGIDPRSFYAGRFAGGAGTHNYFSEKWADFDIELDRLRFLVGEIQGPAVLDVGCGSGPYGGSLKASGVERLVGLDLDPGCVSLAKLSYDNAFEFSLHDPLPFEDESFDTVISCDVFGHVEFRRKDKLIAEIARVTKPGGKTVHVIESGFIPYDRIDPADRSDPIVQYVLTEGHVAIETAEEIRERWSPYFTLSIENGLIYPIYPVATYLMPGWGPASDLIAQFTASERRAVQCVLGLVSQRLKQEIRAADPARLIPDHTSPDPIRKPSGLIYLVGQKIPRAAAVAS